MFQEFNLFFVLVEVLQFLELVDFHLDSVVHLLLNFGTFSDFLAELFQFLFRGFHLSRDDRFGVYRVTIVFGLSTSTRWFVVTLLGWFSDWSLAVAGSFVPDAVGEFSKLFSFLVNSGNLVLFCPCFGWCLFATSLFGLLNSLFSSWFWGTRPCPDCLDGGNSCGRHTAASR